MFAKLAFLFILALTVSGAFAQPHPPGPPQPGPPHQRDHRADHDRPGWCRHYDWRDFRREFRQCDGRARCEWRVRQKAERCDLKR